MIGVLDCENQAAIQVMHLGWTALIEPSHTFPLPCFSIYNQLNNEQLKQALALAGFDYALSDVDNMMR